MISANHYSSMGHFVFAVQKQLFFHLQSSSVAYVIPDGPVLPLDGIGRHLGKMCSLFLSKCFCFKMDIHFESFLFFV